MPRRLDDLSEREPPPTHRNKTPLRPAKQGFIRAPGAASGSVLRVVAPQHSLPKSPPVAVVGEGEVRHEGQWDAQPILAIWPLKESPCLSKC